MPNGFVNSMCSDVSHGVFAPAGQRLARVQKPLSPPIPDRGRFSKSSTGVVAARKVSVHSSIGSGLSQARVQPPTRLISSEYCTQGWDDICAALCNNLQSTISAISASDDRCASFILPLRNPCRSRVIYTYPSAFRCVTIASRCSMTAGMSSSGTSMRAIVSW